MPKKEKEGEIDFGVLSAKSKIKIDMNRTLLGICFTLFTFIIALNPDLLLQNTFLTFQLVCAIPLLITSIFARSKLSGIAKTKRWEYFGFITFILGYGFMINVIGMFLISIISFNMGIIFYSVNIISALTYSAIEISFDKTIIKGRILKDGLFIAIIIILGILPSL